MIYPHPPDVTAARKAWSVESFSKSPATRKRFRFILNLRPRYFTDLSRSEAGSPFLGGYYFTKNGNWEEMGIGMFGRDNDRSILRLLLLSEYQLGLWWNWKQRYLRLDFWPRFNPSSRKI